MPTATNSYVAFVRGINVGGKCLVNMAKLRLALQNVGLASVQTYIQSGNILFQSSEKDTTILNRKVSNTIAAEFGIEAQVATVTAPQWRKVFTQAPMWWGKDADWKHNLIILLPPTKTEEVIEAIGELNAGIEHVEAGDRVVYQSILTSAFSRSASSRLVTRPVYKHITIRNYNTSKKLAELVVDSGMMST